MNRARRLGVALVLGPPVAAEVDGLRRALGDRALGTIEPHLTLVPPVNVDQGRVGEAVSVVRTAAGAVTGPLRVQLGPVATFLPESPVLYLAVDEAGVDAARLLRGACLSGPLDRPGRWPFVAHVTICDEVGPDRAAGAMHALRDYRAGALLERIVLLEQFDGAWHELVDAHLGPASTWGRGGIETRAVTGTVPGPDVQALFDEHGHRPWEASGPVAEMLVVTALREQHGAKLPAGAAAPGGGCAGVPGWACAGAAVAWCGPPGSGLPHMSVAVGEQWRRQGLGRMLVGSAADEAARRGWTAPSAIGHGPMGFFSACSPWVAELGD